MKINLHRLAGTGFGAALAIMLSVDVDAAPLSIAQAPTQISAFDGLVTQAWVRGGAVAIASLGKWPTAQEGKSIVRGQ